MDGMVGGTEGTLKKASQLHTYADGCDEASTRALHERGRPA